MRILVAEDDPIIQKVVSRAIERRTSHRVEMVESGDALVKRWKETWPDLVISDIRLDRSSGLEACKEIRTQDPQARIIFMSGSCEPEEMAEARAIGPMLEKPFEVSELLELVESCGSEAVGAILR